MAAAAAAAWRLPEPSLCCSEPGPAHVAAPDAAAPDVAATAVAVSAVCAPHHVKGKLWVGFIKMDRAKQLAAAAAARRQQCSLLQLEHLPSHACMALQAVSGANERLCTICGAKGAVQAGLRHWRRDCPRHSSGTAASLNVKCSEEATDLMTGRCCRNGARVMRASRCAACRPVSGGASEPSAPLAEHLTVCTTPSVKPVS